jgi:hypothetical protein
VISIVGGRAAMISAATGAIDLVVAPLAANTASATSSPPSSSAGSSRSRSAPSESRNCFSAFVTY